MFYFIFYFWLIYFNIIFSNNFKIVLLIVIDLILLISPGSLAFLFKQRSLKVVISFGIALNLIYLLNIKYQLTALSLAASLKEFSTSSFVTIKFFLILGLI